MIVRVIQLEIYYKDNQQRLKEIKSIPCVRALFDFYEQVVEKDIEAKLKIGVGIGIGYRYRVSGYR
jgi:hypothetical protein